MRGALRYDAAVAGPGPPRVHPEDTREHAPVSSLVGIVGWCFLFLLCWPLALLALVLWPLVWLISLPFRLIGISLEAVFALIRAILFLPARLLGARPATR